MIARIVLATAAALSLTACDVGDFTPGDRYKSDFHYSYDLNPGGRIEAESFNGIIDITGDGGNKIQIEGTKYGATEELLNAVRIEISPSPDAITIRAERPPDMHGSMGARFTIHAPKNALVDRISTSNGAIRIADLAGDGRFRTSNAAIHIQNLAGAVDAHTSNGPIDVSGTRGDAVLRTSNGGISADGVSGTVQAATNNGPIRVQIANQPAEPVKLETSNGAIELTMLQLPKADVRAITSNGRILLQLPPDAGARVSAHTSNGRISTDFNISMRGEVSNNSLEGQIGAGGPNLVLTTSNGPIRIRNAAGGSQPRP